ncbi:ribonuclease P [Sulfolobus sp. S-194]|uniref:ribonuclease P protein component 4 n=1 Tax=Sulfolobus sp. S-194 TaxID=2512240 RepID=UPI001436E204|nr:ribonuclease P [Sulfolobus sp. S-194]QIW24924.1 ribonuclease P [Sulfolobus sp. S-194]
MVRVKNVKIYKKRSLQLIRLAIELAKNNNIELARMYIKLALLYSRKLRFKIPIEYKRLFCRKCFTPLIIGVTERRRIKNKVLVRTCLYCGWTRRYKLQYKTTNKKSKS